MKKIKSILSIVCVALMLSTCFVFAGCGEETKTTAGDKNGTVAQAETKAESNADTPVAPADNADTPVSTEKVTVEISVKDFGKITVELNPQAAPITVANFVKLVKSGFYDGITFHRIIDGFMIQGGDPTGTGTGGSDETIKGEFSANGVVNKLSHTRGAISMARSQLMDSASSQFFIVHEDSTFLDGQYAAFGYVVDGMSVVDKIATGKYNSADSNGTLADKSEQPVIEYIKVIE